jgi:hypothetical protein
MSNLSTTLTNYLSTATGIIDAEFVRVTVYNPTTSTGVTYCFSNSYQTETFSDSSGNSVTAVGTFTALGGLLTISGHQRDISATAYDTQITLVGIDQTKVGQILEVGQNYDSNGNPIPNNFHSGLKGSKVEIWRGFYNNTYNLIADANGNNPALRYTGIVTSYHISEDKQASVDSFILTLQCSSFKTVLENRFAGRHTNGASWNTISGTNVNPNYDSNGNPTNSAYDSGMDRVQAISDTTFNFGLPVA